MTKLEAGKNTKMCGICKRLPTDCTCGMTKLEQARELKKKGDADPTTFAHPEYYMPAFDAYECAIAEEQALVKDLKAWNEKLTIDLQKAEEEIGRLKGLLREWMDWFVACSSDIGDLDNRTEQAIGGKMNDILERLKNYNPPDRTIENDKQTAKDIEDAVKEIICLREEIRHKDLLISGMEKDIEEMHGEKGQMKGLVW